jgi:DNA-binding GntR family transcriptional regulator
MGVSRTPVRESLRILQAEGLVELIPHKGSYVNQPPPDEIRDMFEVMGVLEGTCARLATQKMNEKQFKRIEALHLELERHYRSRDHEAYLSSNNDLHVLIQDLTGNKILREVINGLRQKILLYRHRQLYHLDRFDQSIQEHRSILEAFRNRDELLAEACVKRHLANQCKVLLEIYPDTKNEGKKGRRRKERFDLKTVTRKGERP